MSLTVGDVVRTSVSFRLNDVAVDPTTLELRVLRPDGVTTTYTWPPEGVIKQAPYGDALLTGEFYADLEMTLAGVWLFTWVPTGDVTKRVVEAVRVSPALEAITIQVRTSAPAAIPGVRVFVARDEALLSSGTTGADGDVHLAVPPGSYLVTGYKDKVSAMSLEIDVADNGGVGTQTFGPMVGEVFSIATAGVPAVVRLFGHLASPSGVVDDVPVFVEQVSDTWVTPAVDETGFHLSTLHVREGRREIRTNKDGYWELDVLAGARLLVEIPSTRFRAVVRVPTGVNVLNLRDARPDVGSGAEVGVSSDGHGFTPEGG